MDGIHVTELAVFATLFLLVTVMGFAAGRWRRGATMHSLDERGLGGRSFDGWVTWFLLGGDLYTPYTVVAFPLVPYVLARMWSVCHVHGYVTPADFARQVRGTRGHPRHRPAVLHRPAASSAASSSCRRCRR